MSLTGLKRGLSLAGLLLMAIATGCGDNPTGTIITPSDTTGAPPPTPDPWLAEHGHRLASLTSDDFKDLQFLKEVIGDRRIVQLGESGHGVAEFNRAKVRLIRFFHEEMDFDVIAFESDLFACFHADRSADGLSAKEVMQSCIYGVWHTSEVVPLFSYLKETKESDDPLILAGFDMKLSSWMSRGFRAQFMRGVVAKVDAAYAEEVLALEKELDLLYDDSDWRASVASKAGDLKTRYQALHDFLMEHEGSLLTAYPDDPATPLVAQQTARYTVRMVDYVVASQMEGCAGTEARDISMAENATFLADRVFPDRKILIWAHNFHIRHNNRAMVGGGCYTMGEGIQSRHRSELYTVGLYMYQGSAAMNNRTVYTIYPAMDNTLEGYLHAAGEPYLFLDLLHLDPVTAPAWIFEETMARSWGYSMTTFIPREQYDGLLHIEQVHSPQYVY
ncbi:erythromycin esterase family protein [Gemmatimonadota bacterium]